MLKFSKIFKPRELCPQEQETRSPNSYECQRADVAPQQKEARTARSDTAWQNTSKRGSAASTPAPQRQLLITTAQAPGAHTASTGGGAKAK